MLTHPLSLLEARLLSAGFALSRRALLRQRRSNGAQARCSGIIAISGCRNLATSRTARARNGVDTSPSTHGSASPVVATGGAATTQTRIDTSNLAAAHQQRYGAIAHWELQLPAKGAVPHAPSQQAPGREASRTLAPPRGLLAQPSAAGARYASGRTAAGAAARQVHGLSSAHMTTADDPRDVVRRIILSGGFGHADGSGSGSTPVTQQQSQQPPGGTRGAHAAASEAVAMVSSATGAPLQPPWCDNGGCSAHMAPQGNQDAGKAARRLEERLQHLPGPDLAPLALALLPRLPPPRVAQLAVALAKLGDFDAGCKAQLAEHVVMHMDQFTPSELADVAWSLARCAFYDLTFNEALAGRLSSAGEVWDPASLTRVLWAFGRFRFLPGHDPTLLDGALTAMVQHLVRQQQQQQQQEHTPKEQAQQARQEVQEQHGPEHDLSRPARERERVQQQEEQRRGARADQEEGQPQGAAAASSGTVAAAATPARTATCVSEVVFAAEQLHWRDSRLQRAVADYARGNMQAFGPEALGKLAAGLAGYAAVDGPLVAALCGRAEQLAGGMGVLDINRILLLLTKHHEEVRLRSVEAHERTSAAAAAGSSPAAEGSSPSPAGAPSPGPRPQLGEAEARCLAALARRAVELSEPSAHSAAPPPPTAAAPQAGPQAEAAALEQGLDNSPSSVPMYDYPPLIVDGPIDAPPAPPAPPVAVLLPTAPPHPTASPLYYTTTIAATVPTPAAPGLISSAPNATPLRGFPNGSPALTATPGYGLGLSSSNTEIRGAGGSTSTSSSSSSVSSVHAPGGSDLRSATDVQLLSEAVSRFSALGCVGEHVMQLATRALAAGAQQPAGIL